MEYKLGRGLVVICACMSVGYGSVDCKGKNINIKYGDGGCSSIQAWYSGQNERSKKYQKRKDHCESATEMDGNAFEGYTKYECIWKKLSDKRGHECHRGDMCQ